MPTRVQFPPAIELLVQFIEETDPNEIVDQTLAKFRGSVSIHTMLRASALMEIYEEAIELLHAQALLVRAMGCHDNGCGVPRREVDRR